MHLILGEHYCETAWQRLQYLWRQMCLWDGIDPDDCSFAVFSNDNIFLADYDKALAAWRAHETV